MLHRMRAVVSTGHEMLESMAQPYLRLAITLDD
jgi:hypothetical protein